MRLRRSALCLALAACLAACGQVDGSVRGEGPALTSIPWSGPAYVMDRFGRAWQHPKDLAPAGRLYLDGLTWRDWGATRLWSMGTAWDTSCLSGCPDGVDNPPSYRVKVVLSGLVRRGDVAYYSQMSLRPVHPPAPFWADGYDSTELDVPDD